MTSSAIAARPGNFESRPCGLRLITKSNFVGWTTGRSAGFLALKNAPHIGRLYDTRR